MISDAWTSVDLPLLTAFVEAEAADQFPIDPLRVARAAGLMLDERDVFRAVSRLEGAGYLTAETRTVYGSAPLCRVTVLTERTRRATRQWPPDDTYQALIELLLHEIEQAADESIEGRLRAALLAMLGLGRGVGIDLTDRYRERIVGKPVD